MKRFSRVVSLVLVVIFMFTSMGFAFNNESSAVKFKDVPGNHWAYDAVHRLRSLNITDGIGDNRFGMGQTIKRSEFVAFLVKLMALELIYPEEGSFTDNKDSSQWYYAPIETALEYNIIDATEDFRVNDPITREEMAIMIIRALGYGDLANQLTNLDNSFNDVWENSGYITMAKDFEIISGVGNNMFKPKATAKREEAAVMMIRMYEKLSNPINELHGFYAIRSAHQGDMIRYLDSVGFGWSRLEYDMENKQVVLNTSKSNNNEYAVPKGFEEPVSLAKGSGALTQLMVTTENITINNEKVNNIFLNEYILTNLEVRTKVINDIVKQVNATTMDGNTVSFDGVIIDFENMKGEVLKKSFNEFLRELKTELNKINKKLYVAVHPQRKPGEDYYDAYDYKFIGAVADKVILMAHDYYARKLTDENMASGYTLTPLTPIDEIYYALKAITDKNTGVEDISKVWFQISFDSVQWKLKEGKVINKYPYHPNYEAIQQRLVSDDITLNYSKTTENPYATFFDPKDGTENILWYEDEQSIKAKVKLAKIFGIQGISLWRLGNIPEYKSIDKKNIYLNIWENILYSTKKS